MVVPGPSKVVYNCSNNSIILSADPLLYPPICLFYSQISHSAPLRPSPPPPPSMADQPSVFVLRSSFTGWNPLFNPLASPRWAPSWFLPAFISIPFPSVPPLFLNVGRVHSHLPVESVIIPSIPSRSLRPHIIRGCAEGMWSRAQNRNRARAAPRGIVTKSYN